MIDDAHDRSVERFARVTPPRGHQARVLARSGPGADLAMAARETRRRRAWRRALPLAATVMAACGVVAGLGVYVLDHDPYRPVALVLPAPEASWTGKGVDVPVLPPRAYWQMSALDEFEQLRPGTLANEGVQRVRGTSSPIPRTAPQAPSHAAPSRSEPAPTALPGRPAWLAAIVLEDITVAPIAIAEFEPLPPIALAPIVIVPIAIAPIAEEIQ